MLKEQLAVPAVLTAVQVTVVVPSGNPPGEVRTAPEASLHVTVGAGLPVAVGAKGTRALHCPAVLGTTMSAGQVIAGGVAVVLEFTVTVKLHWEVLPAVSV